MITYRLLHTIMWYTISIFSHLVFHKTLLQLFSPILYNYSLPHVSITLTRTLFPYDKVDHISRQTPKEPIKHTTNGCHIRFGATRITLKSLHLSAAVIHAHAHTHAHTHTHIRTHTHTHTHTVTEEIYFRC